MVSVTLNPAIDHAVTIPRFEANAVNRVATELRTAGGKGVNVASFLSDYGLPVTVTGFLGRTNAQLFDVLFASKDLKDEFVRVDGENRVNLKILNPEASEVTDINYPGLTPSPKDLSRLESTLDRLSAAHEWFIFSGSLPPGVPPATYRTLTRQLRAQRRKVLLDTSGEALRQGLRAKPTVIKPNARELEEALGRSLTTQADLIEAARTLAADGIETVIISRGADGALFVGSNYSLAARYAKPLIVRTTVGAGDALVAGYLAARAEELDPESAARLAVAFSIAALRRKGSAPLPARPGIAELAGTVEVAHLQDP